MEKYTSTTPLINYLTGTKELYNYWSNRLILMHFIHGKEGSVKFHKKRLGKQKYCWQGEYKNWVWEGKDWRAYASKGGSSIEIKEDLTLTDAINAFINYLSMVGLTDEDFAKIQKEVNGK